MWGLSHEKGATSNNIKQICSCVEDGTESESGVEEQVRPKFDVMGGTRRKNLEVSNGDREKVKWVRVSV